MEHIQFLRGFLHSQKLCIDMTSCDLLEFWLWRDVICWAPIVFFHTFAKYCVHINYYYVGTVCGFFSSTAAHVRIFTIGSFVPPIKRYLFTFKTVRIETHSLRFGGNLKTNEKLLDFFNVPKLHPTRSNPSLEKVGNWQIVLMTQESWVKRRNWRCNFRPAIAWMKPSVHWKNEPVRAPSQTHANVELERVGESQSMCEVLCATPSA